MLRKMVCCFGVFLLQTQSICWSLSGKGQDICALIDASYLRINLFLFIIYLDYSRHLKRGNNNSEAAGGRREFTAQEGYIITEP